VVPNIGTLFNTLEVSIDESFVQQLFGEEIPTQYRSWVSVAIKQGGTTIPKPVEMVDPNYLASTCECSHLLDSLKGKEKFDPVFHSETLKEVMAEIRTKKADNLEIFLEKIESSIEKKGARILDYLKEKWTGTWFAATPNNLCGTALSAVEFRNKLRDRYGMKLLDSPSHCDGCNEQLSTTHALSCKVGGLIHVRHDESRVCLGCLACAGFKPSNVRDEPQINPCHDTRRKDERGKLIEPNTGVECEINSDRGDLLVHGFWDRNTDCIIDVHIVDVN